MILVGNKVPDFTVPAVLGNDEIVGEFNLHKAIAGKPALIFFYPLDFTFVCPSELIAVDHRMEEFKKRGIEVISVSIDSHYTHHAWRNTPVEKGGIGKVKYTMAADIKHTIMQSFGIAHPAAGVALRASFMVDRHGVVRSQIVNDLPIGRNFDEVLRTFDAIEFNEKHGEVCPAGWQKGDKGMKASPEGVAAYLAESSKTL